MLYNKFEEIKTSLAKKEITVLEIVNHYLLQIENKNEALNAFLEVYKDEALTKAKELDLKIANNQSVGKLCGMVIGIKDNLCYDNHSVGAASKILDGFVSQFTATAVQKLLNEDVIIIGRLNCDEFAMGASNENSS